MEKVRTRSQRHIKKNKNATINRKSIVPLVGLVLVTTPLMVTAVPQETQAASQAVYDNTANFISEVGPIAQQVSDQYDLYASVMLAQAILESANGFSTLASAPYYNLFGVKGYGYSNAVWLPTQEFLNGEWHVMNEPFRRYNSYWESFVDHAQVLRARNPHTGNGYYAGAWKSNTGSYLDATAALTGRYATDPAYNQKLNKVIANYNLTRFDTPALLTNVTVETEQAATSTQVSSKQTYTVQNGDSLWSIANHFGVSMDAIIVANHLSGELIVVGQQLSI